MPSTWISLHISVALCGRGLREAGLHVVLAEKTLYLVAVLTSLANEIAPFEPMQETPVTLRRCFSHAGEYVVVLFG